MRASMLISAVRNGLNDTLRTGHIGRSAERVTHRRSLSRLDTYSGRTDRLSKIARVGACVAEPDR